MRAFDLEKFKKGETCVDSDGHEMLFVMHNPVFHESCRVIAMGRLDLKPRAYSELGTAHIGIKNLFLADKPKVKKSRYVGLWKRDDNEFHSSTGETEEKMRAQVNNNAWKLVQFACIEWEEEA